MSFANIVFAATCWLCSLVFGAIAYWAFKRKDPMHFWAGSTVGPEEIADIPSYNRANGIMWTIYTLWMVITGVLSLFSITIGTLLLVILCVPGIIILIVAYKRIYNKYKNTSVTHKTGSDRAKTPKAVVTVLVSVSAMILILMGALYFYGEQDPNVIFLDDQVQIKAMYGLRIEFSEIEEISLIESSMKDIGIGARTNGYGGFGQTLKGNFKSITLGETLLFVKSKSSPTIKIERTGKKDIYISLRNSEDTENLYNRFKVAIPLE